MAFDINFTIVNNVPRESKKVTPKEQEEIYKVMNNYNINTKKQFGDNFMGNKNKKVVKNSFSPKIKYGSGGFLIGIATSLIAQLIYNLFV